MSLTRKLLGCALIACFSLPAFAMDNADHANNTNAHAQQEVADASTMQNNQAQDPQAQTVNINTASAEQLESVKGIGKKRAQAIVSYREKNGPFKSVDDLANVKGFTKHFVEKHRAMLAI